MEFINQNGYAPTITEYRHGKTLVKQRPYDDRSSRYIRDSQWMGDSNPERRESAMSLNKKSGSQQARSSGGIAPYRATTTSSLSRPKPRPRRRSPPQAEELVEQWNKKSQLDDTESSDDDGNARFLGLSGTSKDHGRADKASASKGKNPFPNIKRIRLTVSPEARTKSLPSTSRGTSRLEQDSDDDGKYWHFSQDGTAISASSPRKNVRVEVSIGLGDGDSIASSSSVETFPHPPRASAFGKTKKRQGPSAPSDVNNDADCRRKCFSFGEENGVGRMGESDEGSEDDLVMTDRDSGKGKGKEVVRSKKVDEWASIPPRSKGVEGKSKARQKEPPISPKARPKVTKTHLLKVNSTKRANDSSSKQRVVPSSAKKIPASTKKSKPKSVRLGEDSDLERLESDSSDTPRPVKQKHRGIANPGNASGKPSARRERTPPLPTSATGTKRKRPSEDDPTDLFSGFDTSSRAAPRKKQDTVLPRTTENLAGPKRKRGQEREKDAATTKEKAATTKEKIGISVKDKSSRVASPKGFPAPMRAPVRVNEALLSSQQPERGSQPDSGSQSEQPKKRYRRNSAGIEEEIALGPNG